MAKVFTLITDQKNRGGYRVSLQGIDISGFNQNPVMLWQHKRYYCPEETQKPKIPVIGGWRNIKVSQGEITAETDIDEGDEFCSEISRKVDKGYLSAASVGLRVHEVSSVYNDVEGIDEVVITKSEIIEASIVDIPMDSGCTVKLHYGDDLKEITSLEELQQAFSINQNKEVTKSMNDEQFKLFMAQQAEILAQQAEQNKLVLAALSDLKKPEVAPVVTQNQEQNPPVQEPQKPVSIADTLRQNAESRQPQAGGKKDFKWYVKNDVEALTTMKQNSPQDYAKLCAESGIVANLNSL